MSKPPTYPKYKYKTNSNVGSNAKKKTENTFVKSGRSFSTYLIIVESPSKCKKIEEYLGEEYKCIASKGHIREIDGLKSIQTKDKFQITFQNMESKQNHIENMRQIIQQYEPENIYLASDDDREGEAIAWHICEIFHLPISTTKRILFHEITKPAIQEAIRQPTTINMSMVYAQHSRQVLDIIVGYKISPLLWKHIHNNKSNGLSAGRCQTPALRLIYENEKNNLDVWSVLHKIVGNFFATNMDFHLYHISTPKSTKPLSTSEELSLGEQCLFETETEVIEFLKSSKSHKYSLQLGKTKCLLKPPPKPYTTSLLLQASNNHYHYSPKLTMELCQTLYQMGLITYMRTDSTKYSQVFLNGAKDFILKEYGSSSYLGKLENIQNGEVSNPHEAIRATNIHMRYIQDENRALCNMYSMIWHNTVESCMCDAKYDCIPVYISTFSEKHLFYKSLEIPVFSGWKQVNIQGKHTEKYNDELNLLRATHLRLQCIQQSGETFTYNSLESVVSIQNKHHHYSESSLIQKLEDLGIGRPSTYSSIITTIQERGYVVKKDIEGKKIQCNEWTIRGDTMTKTTTEKVFGNEKNKLVIQPIGIITMEFLLAHFQSLFDYQYTKKMELDLDDISMSPPQQSENIWYIPCEQCSNEIKQLVKPLAKLSKQSYPIGEGGHELVFHQYGASIKTNDEEGNVLYKKVKKGFVLDLEKLKKGEYTLSELLEIEKDCLGNYEEEPVYLRSGKYGAYIVYNGVNISVKNLKKEPHLIKLEDVIPFIVHHYLSKKVDGEDILGTRIKEKTENVGETLPPPPPSANTLRELTPELSIRKGKFGAYIYYKTAKMATPSFFNLKSFKQGFKTCKKEALLEWIRETYSLPV